MTRAFIIVEDEPKLASLLSDYFRQTCCSTQITANGNEIREWLKTNACDLMILDLMILGKDSLTFKP